VIDDSDMSFGEYEEFYGMEEEMSDDTKRYIEDMESLGVIDRECKFCKRIFYPELEKGARLDKIFAPRHKASLRCRSGHYNHCTCDTCF
jgi:hypothetical protein